MNRRFDLPPEVMPGPRLPRASETQVKAPPAPKQVAPGVFKGTDGKLFTVLAFPPAHSKNVAMLHADFGPENEEDDPVDPSRAQGILFDARDYTAGAFLEMDEGLAQRAAILEAMTKLRERVEAVQEDTRRQTEAYRAQTGPRFRVTRHGISALLPIRDLTPVEMVGCDEVTAEMYCHEMIRRGI